MTLSCRNLPGQETEFKDDTQFSSYGVYALAKVVIEGIKQNKMGLTQYLLDDIVPFNPADPVEKCDLSKSPDVTIVKPNGN